MAVDIKLTTVKLLTDKYQEFKVTTMSDNMNLQKLVNRSIYLYNTSPDFRSTIIGCLDLQVSGSSF